ncbi:helix-turn-helix transcriptional regulator [Pedomonas sp. V897]|uniref:helix-turn-helix transcriptional regulator n=1 Tax=Pedomonas sp. V897 TaxID=3446482 RepID=UPI003EE2FFF3
MFTPQNIEAVTIRSPADIRRAAEEFKRIVSEMSDLRIAPCHNIASKQPMVDADGNVLAADVFGWAAPHERWWQNSRLALHSPLPCACRYESEPFWCNKRGFYTRQPNRYLEALDLSSFEVHSLSAAAIVVPIHLPFGQIAAVSFSPSDDRDDLSREYEEMADELAVYARTFIAGYVKAMGTSQWLPSGARLSKREVECLRWAAIGKTDEEISMIMARSRATVRFHIHNASLKLDAVNRSQTVFKAAQLGFLSVAS